MKESLKLEVFWMPQITEFWKRFWDIINDAYCVGTEKVCEQTSNVELLFLGEHSNQFVKHLTKTLDVKYLTSRNWHIDLVCMRLEERWD